MNSISVTVSKKGSIVLPAHLRKQLHMESGTKVLLTREDNKLILQPVPSYTDKLAGLTAGSFGKTGEEVQEYIDEERKER